jgi:hypothetical protein
MIDDGNGTKRKRRGASAPEAARDGLKAALERWIRDRRAAGGSDDDVKAAQIARRIVVSYGGEQGLRSFIRMLEEGKPGTEIASRFGVTRQRANQWKDAIGMQRTSYEVRPLLRRLIGAEASGA